MAELLEVLPPGRVLDLATYSPSLDSISELENALLRSTCGNLQYRREVCQVLAFHLRADALAAPLAQPLLLGTQPPVEADDEAVGCLIDHLAVKKLNTWAYASTFTASAKTEARLRAILHRCALEASMSKTGDQLLHTLLRLQLPSQWIAAIGGAPPYRALNATKSDQANDLVQRWLTLPTDALPDEISYDNTTPECLSICGGLLNEVFDNVPAAVAINSEALTRSEPSLVAWLGFGNSNLPDLLGCVLPGCEVVVVAPPTRPLASLVAYWASTLSDKMLHTALVEPQRLAPGSVLKQWLLEANTI